MHKFLHFYVGTFLHFHSNIYISTTVVGEKEKIFNMIKQIYDAMDMSKCNFAIDVKISNTCGCQNNQEIQD